MDSSYSLPSDHISVAYESDPSLPNYGDNGMQRATDHFLKAVLAEDMLPKSIADTFDLVRYLFVTRREREKVKQRERERKRYRERVIKQCKNERDGNKENITG